jgi:cellulose synthase/poly-beta-1,6-N-acetylglucosamine synthase-like glycosyltransferase
MINIFPYKAQNNSKYDSWRFIVLSQLENVIYWITQLIQVFIFAAGCYFFGISIFGWIKKKEDSALKTAPAKRFALIIAAHNEECVIANIIESLKMQSYPKNLYDIFVVADNCTDKTAEISEKHGANIYRRINEVQRGKGFALEWI